VIGYSFGGAGGSFNTPNLTDRFAVGVGSRALGAAGGSADSSLPAHAHTIDHGHTGSAGNDSPDHTHGVDHYHLLGGTAASAGSHWHQPSNAGDFVVGGGAVGGPPQGWTGPAAISNVDGDKYGKVGGTGNAGDHTHTVSGNTNYMSQTPGQGPNSTGASARHSHPVTVNGMSGASGQAGVAPAGTNMPPFLAIQHIIRCK
jgi:hypothetical protein